MQRLDIFRSGLPTIVAGIGLLVFTYLATVRRDRLARYWALAWGLLLLRYVGNALYTDAQPLPDYVKSVLRTGFAVTLLAGVWSLQRPPLRTRWILAAATAIPAVSQAIVAVLHDWHVGTTITLAVQALVLLPTAFLLARTPSLPMAERSGTAVALAAYALISTVAPLLPNGSPMLVVAVAASSVFLLLIAFGLFAIYFRKAYATELQAITTTSSQLASALGTFVSVCMHCRAVQDEQQQWQPLEVFVSRQRGTRLSHGLCDACVEKHYGDLQPG
ncbi:MAG: hypothetical protein K2R93_00915 [Gemmatimonadaceae bacterium]|nr:hypothetical protein [Gemmatimonadaceae bacterium]